MSYYLGIDPGKIGALVVFDDTKFLAWLIMPKTIENEIDIPLLNKWIQTYTSTNTEIFCVLEDVHSIFGMSAASNFQFGRGLGILEGVLGANNIEFAKVTPKVWQKEIWKDTTPIAEETGKKLKSGLPQVKIDTKATSLLVAKQLFPDVDFLATKRSSVAHDGWVDAMLITEYCRRKFKTK